MEQKRTLSTATWRIMTGWRTAAAADKENAWGNKCLNLYRWEAELTFILIWYPACQRLIDKFSSLGSGSYDLKWTVVCVRFGLCFLLVPRQEQTQWFTVWEEKQSDQRICQNTSTWQTYYFSNINVYILFLDFRKRFM